MAPKGKKAANNAPAEEPEAKKAKAEDDKTTATEEVAAFEEADAPKDNRAVLKDTIAFEPSEMTLNAIPTCQGKLLMAISEGGMAYLMAGARANVAQKSGRYMFEAKIVQTMTPVQQRHRQEVQAPRQLLRVGFSTAASSLLLGDDDHSVCFDADGSFISEKKRQPGKALIYRSTVVGVVLNLDPKSPNFNTVTLYCEGKKVSDAKPLPECLKGKPLFPHVCYRNVSVNVNFGSSALTALPFKCRMLQGAAQSDVLVTASPQSKDNKYEVVLPVAFPDEGTFDWLDTWKEQNPKYVELSDRMIMEWARASGCYSRTDRKGSNDRPNFSFGIPALDDFSLRKLIAIVAPIVPRNYVVMEVKSNLVAAERTATLKRFNNPCYKKVAHVVMGEPNKDYKALVRSKILKDKQAKSDADWKVKQVALQHKRTIAAKQKELTLARKEAEEKAAKRKAEAEKKKEEEAAAKAEAEKKDKPTEEKEGEEKKDEPAGEEKKDEPAGETATEEKAKEEEVKEEEKKDETVEKKAEEEAKKDEEKEEEEEPMETEPPVAELNDEEKETNFLPKRWPDLPKEVMNAAYSLFTTPDKSEGFDDITYEWDSAADSKEYLKVWVTHKKLSTRIEDLKPGEFFLSKNADFSKSMQGWRDCQKALPKDTPAAKAEEEEELNVFKVEDINNIGENRPLFENFEAEDWALAALRFELHMLTTSFKRDCNDPDRTGVPMEHVNFYFHKYFNKMFSPAVFGFDAFTGTKDFLNLIKDSVTAENNLLVSLDKEDMDNFDIFIKRTEHARRERSRRIEAGDETARLNFQPAKQELPPPPMREGGDGRVVRAEDRRQPYVPRYDNKGKGKGKDIKGKGKYR